VINVSVVTAGFSCLSLLVFLFLIEEADLIDLDGSVSDLFDSGRDIAGGFGS
jgi:hypothetical protein